MFQRRGPARTRDVFLLSGWLFADLLLALMMIFLISINGASPPPPGCGTPSPSTATAASQTSGAASSAPSLNTLADATSTPTGDSGFFATPTPCPTTPTPTPTPFPCGLDLNNKLDMTHDPITVNDVPGLAAETTSGQQNFDDQIRGIFSQYSNKTAGLVEVYAGGSDPGAGQTFALHAIDALKKLGEQQPPFIFDPGHAFFQNLWDGSIGSDQVTMFVIFYFQSVNGSCVQQ